MASFIVVLTSTEAVRTVRPCLAHTLLTRAWVEGLTVTSAGVPA